MKEVRSLVFNPSYVYIGFYSHQQRVLVLYTFDFLVSVDSVDILSVQLYMTFSPILCYIFIIIVKFSVGLHM
jgi:hypothetical protein